VWSAKALEAKSVFGSETHFHKWGKCKRLNPMASKCTPILGVAFVQESQIFKALVEREKKHQIEPLGYHWKGLEV
jgi:hypothetical protein